jgi:hypothetical protein
MQAYLGTVAVVATKEAAATSTRIFLILKIREENKLNLKTRILKKHTELQ